MTVPSYARWSAYALAAALTLAAAVWVTEDEAPAVVGASARSTAPAAGARAAGAGPAAASPRLALPTARQVQDPTSDPFAVVGAAAEDGPVVAAVRAAPTAVAAAAAPALPFIYLGSWKESGKTLIFVQRDDRSYKIAGPGPLDPEYAVQSVDEQRITLKYLPLGTLQELRLDAAPAGAARGLASASAQGSPEPDQPEN